MRIFVWFTDAAIKGTKYRDLGGFAYGLKWVFPLSTRMLRLLNIPILEFLALLGQLIIVGSILPDPGHSVSFKVRFATDSVTSTWRLQEQHGSSQNMAFILDIFINRPEFIRLRHALTLAHVFGKSNPLADNLSRGDEDTSKRTFQLLQIKTTDIKIPVVFHQLVDRVCSEAELILQGLPP